MGTGMVIQEQHVLLHVKAMQIAQQIHSHRTKHVRYQFVVWTAVLTTTCVRCSSNHLNEGCLQ